MFPISNKKFTALVKFQVHFNKPGQPSDQERTLMQMCSPACSGSHYLTTSNSVSSYSIFSDQQYIF